MPKNNITLPVSINADDLAVALARELNYEALLKLVRDVDKIIADWGFTKKVHDYFSTEMRILAEEEGKPLPKEMPKPRTEAQTAGVECRKDAAVIDEIPGAYKNIDTVMENQSDLVEVVAVLKQVLCVKG